MGAALFSGLRVGGVDLPNRMVVSPMQQYMGGPDGKVRDWHLVHLGKLAQGGFGLVFTEALATEERGRLTHRDLGAWDDTQLPGLERLAAIIAEAGAVPGAQLNHAGRKASVAPPFFGFEPLGEADGRERGEHPWPVVSASALAANPGWPVPAALRPDEIAAILERFAQATRRVRQAGFQVLNVHGAHGYLIHAFLSPLANQRNDEYGGERANRMRFALEVAEAVRSEWPADKPIFYRLSCVDGLEGGWEIEDTLVLARELAARGVDVIDCSSGGLGRRATPAIIPREPGFQVPYATRVRREAGVPSMAVGLIMGAAQAEAIVANGEADLVAIGREALFNPNWPLHAAVALEGVEAFEAAWPPAYGWWLYRRAKSLELTRRAAGERH